MLAVETKVKVAIGLSLAFVVLNVLDILLTWYALELGAVELGLYMGQVLGLGFWGSVLFKLGISAGIAAVLLDRGHLSLLIFVVGVLCLVCIWNLLMIAGLS